MKSSDVVVKDPRFPDEPGFSAAGKKLAAKTAPKNWRDTKIGVTEFAQDSDPFRLSMGELVEVRRAQESRAQQLLMDMHHEPGGDAAIEELCRCNTKKCGSSKRSVATDVIEQPRTYRRF